MRAPWGEPVRLANVAGGTRTLELEADEATRKTIAGHLGLEALPSLTAVLTLRPWLDGVEISGRFDARVVQLCGVSLEPFEQALSGQIAVAAVPAGSPHAATEEGGELELDAEAPDPPDLLTGDLIDLSAYVVEHLALEIDPFPRKPGATFDYTPDAPEDGPFEALKKLKGD